ncbi:MULTISPECIES: DUF4188 domain-containing protein [Streptomyces]|uniref:DUF4188 domain-containing protein n=1 Tax=Streptomyces TaxID=1883 RepID=UPI0018DF063B|nr:MULTISPECIES: DUF4188 domain-containing protein [Streptomyces]MCZ4094779.1 DUF4188 domain-containing protein [Streptomyces sp. H39-C1]
MRSTDFSLTPAPGQAGAMFVGATRYSGLRAIITLGPGYVRMVREMKRMKGYVWHKVYWRFPFTLGTIAFFADRDELLKFARGKAHHELMCWLTDEGKGRATGGWIRIYTADAAGYTNGVWRAEDGALSHVDTFEPLSTELSAGRAPRPVKHVRHEKRRAQRSAEPRAAAGGAAPAARCPEHLDGRP